MNALPTLLLAMLLMISPRAAAASDAAPTAAAHGAEVAAPAEQGVEELHTHYWWNDVTGESQWEKPEYEFTDPETGNKYYLHPVTKESSWEKYDELEWEEVQEEDKGKGVYFYNSATKTSVWEKPAVLAWRQVALDERQEQAQAPSSDGSNTTVEDIDGSNAYLQEMAVEASGDGKDEL